MRLTLEAIQKLRPWPVYMLAAALPFSLAAVNIAKLFLLIMAMTLAMAGQLTQHRLSVTRNFKSVNWIFLMLGLLAISIIYTSAPMQAALSGWVKYAKLLVFVLALFLIQHQREARKAITILLIAQTFVMITTYLMSWGWQVPWVPADRFSPERVLGVRPDYAAYSGYLDQSLMTAGFAAMCWHLRDHFPGKRGQQAAALLGVLAVINVFLLLPGRSGQVALFAVLLMALFWHVQRQRNVYILVISALLVVAAFSIPSAFRDRMGLVVKEAQTYTGHAEAGNSTGIRLNLWQRASQAIAERPITGYGVASFDHEYRRMEGSAYQASGSNTVHNAHQEYLQWGVQLGVGGIGLLLAFIVFMLRDAQQLQTPARWATQSVVAVFAVACMFNCALFDALIGDYFCFTIALLLAYGSLTSEVQTSRTIAR